MKIIQYAVSAISFTLLSFSAAAADAYIARLASQSLLLDIDSSDQGMIAVGERGHLLRSQDGQNWQQEVVPTLSTLNAVNVLGDRVWAVGHDAVILYQESKDAPWQIQMFAPELEKPLLDVVFFDQSNGITIGAYGSFYRTRDGGKTWSRELHAEFLHPDDKAYLDEIRLESEDFYQQELASILPHLNRVSLSEGTLFLAGEAGLLAKSSDMGETWQRMEVDYTGSFFDIVGLPSGKVVAAGLRGNLFELAPGSDAWLPVNTHITASINSIVALNDSQYVAIGNSGNLVCVNDGQVQNAHEEDGKALLNGVAVNNQIVAVSAAGIKTFKFDEQHNVCDGVSSHL